MTGEFRVGVAGLLEEVGQLGVVDGWQWGGCPLLRAAGRRWGEGDDGRGKGGRRTRAQAAA